MASIRAVSSSVFCRHAEWARHAHTVLAWPSARTHYYLGAPGALERATADVSAIADAVAAFEPVTLVVGRERLADARRRFPSPGSTRHPVRLHPYDGQGQQLDLWMRDIAPVFVTRRGRGAENQGSGLAGVDFNWNGWGNKFRTDDGARLARQLLQDLGVERVSSSLVTEGGAIEVDGQGTLMATKSSIINDNRNPGLSQHDVEAELRRTLGVDKFIWFPGVKCADVTDCHVDALARFVRPGLILLSKPAKGPDSPWTRVYREAREILSSATDAQGQHLEVIDVVEPDIPLDETDEGESPVFSYVNYLIVNGGLILPQFGDAKADAAALEVASRVFGEERQIMPVVIRQLPLLGGGIHCATQQVPWTD
ncbi:hypothetical protein HIM_04884 [Hirsutella minnesotensis 3608]|uniref:Agmatine deiminase n=1 Tax=Hirsutella minnesotensis 3608 TaxID=1043627 RepID=A0A0F8A0Z4_9HYPO|nr:hypothetical protein HIM_04884 [Hirsutella minnesotensis 3608]